MSSTSASRSQPENSKSIPAGAAPGTATDGAGSSGRRTGNGQKTARASPTAGCCVGFASNAGFASSAYHTFSPSTAEPNRRCKLQRWWPVGYDRCTAVCDRLLRLHEDAMVRSWMEKRAPSVEPNKQTHMACVVAGRGTTSQDLNRQETNGRCLAHSTKIPTIARLGPGRVGLGAGSASCL